MLASLPDIRGLLPVELIDDPAARKAAQERLLTKGKLAFLAEKLRRSAMASGPAMASFGVIMLIGLAMVRCADAWRARRKS
jgi:hypothetical protein